MYTFNYGYIGSRTTGNDAGCFMVAGPDWKGDTPAGIKKVFHSETQFGLVGYRTQLFGPRTRPMWLRIKLATRCNRSRRSLTSGACN